MRRNVTIPRTITVISSTLVFPTSKTGLPTGSPTTGQLTTQNPTVTTAGTASETNKTSHGGGVMKVSRGLGWIVGAYNVAVGLLAILS